MKAVAIVCAHNPGKRNLGMYTVDLSARDFMSTVATSYDLVKFIGNERVGSLRYRKISDFEQLAGYRTVLFWGDFQQNPIWGESNYALRVKKEQRGLSVDDARTSWWRNCLLDGIKIPDDQRVYSIGTCFLGGKEFFKSAEELERYRACLSRFSGICPRDIESCRILKEDLALSNVIEGGFDCASLRHPVALSDAGSGGYFTYTMRRTLNDPDLIRKVVARVEEQTGLRGVPIRWLRAKHAKYSLIGLNRYFERCIRTIKGGRFFLTDIYHATINAVTEDVPVICLGDQETVFRDTCDDLKKGYLFQMLDAKPYYLTINPENVDFDQIARVAARLCTLQQNPQREGAVRLRAGLDTLLKRLPGIAPEPL